MGNRFSKRQQNNARIVMQRTENRQEGQRLPAAGVGRARGRRVVRIRDCPDRTVDRMTEKQPPVKVVPEPESRLETLLAQWDDVKAQADEWAARLEALKAGIKTELSATGAPVEGPKAFELTSPYLAAPLRLAWAPRWEFDVKALKAADPVTYVTYARKGGRWELRKAAG